MPAKRDIGICSHVAPSFFVTQKFPSSVPAARKPGRTYDSASATTVPYVSAPVASSVMPPVLFMLVSIFAKFFFERSGEIGYRLSPRCVDLSTRLPPTYMTSALCGERKYGVSQLKRTSSSAESAFCFERYWEMRDC